MILLKRPYADVKGWTVEIHRPNKTIGKWVFGLRKAITEPIGLIKFLTRCIQTEIRLDGNILSRKAKEKVFGKGVADEKTT